MAILMAFQTPELEILGLTTVFGNVSTKGATHNALLLVCLFALDDFIIPFNVLILTQFQAAHLLNLFMIELLFLMCKRIV